MTDNVVLLLRSLFLPFLQVQIIKMSDSTPVKIPKLSELPLNEGDPHHSAWGLYGKDDELGTLNRLTDEVVLSAAREEIRSGVRYARYDDYESRVVRSIHVHFFG